MISGSLIFDEVKVIGNSIVDSIIDMDGTSSLSLLDVRIDNNTANNGVLFDGRSTDDAVIKFLQFTNNRLDTNGDTAMALHNIRMHSY